MKKINLTFLFYIRLFVIGVAIFSNCFAMEMANQDCCFEILPAELNLNIFLRVLELEDFNVKEVPIVLSEFWAFAQTCKKNNSVAKDLLPFIIREIYKLFGVDGLIIIWSTKIPDKHAIREQLLNFCKTNSVKILKNLDKNIDYVKIEEESFSEFNFKKYGTKAHKEITQCCFFKIKFFLETSLIQQEQRQNLLNIIAKTETVSDRLTFLGVIIAENKIGFNYFGFEEFETADQEILIIRSIKEGNFRVFKELLNKLEINSNKIKKKCLNKFLDEAVRSNRFFISKFLLEKMKVNKKTKLRQSIVYAAIESGCKRLMQEILKYKVKINKFHKLYGTLPLNIAIKFGHLNIIKVLIEAGADINLEKYGRETMLMYAVNYERFKIVEYLLSLGMEVNAQDYNGRTSLHMAASNLSTEIMQLLITNGADVNKQDNKKSTPLMEVAAYGGSEKSKEAFKLLLKNGAVIKKDFPEIDEVYNKITQNN